LATELPENNFERYGQYYDVLYQDKDYNRESDYVLSLLRRMGVAKGKIIEFGCGTGRHGRRIAEEGYEVVGIDRSLQMIERARLQDPLPNFTCEVGDICGFDAGRSFDAVLALFHVVSYQTSNEDLVATFRNARRHLKPGGIFLFDVWYAPAVCAVGPSHRIKTVDREFLTIKRAANPVWNVNDNRIDVHYHISVKNKSSGELDEFDEVHPMRYFSLPELDIVAKLTGFRRRAAEEFLTGVTPSLSTWNVCIIVSAV